MSSILKKAGLGLWVWFVINNAVAVETGGSYQTSPPAYGQIPNWNIGWSQGGVTCWNYVGQIGGASGVYLGNGWVLTAAHVGMGNFALNGINYPPVAGSSHTFTSTYGTADLVLYQISPSPNLEPLPISMSAPVAFSQSQSGNSAMILGYGGGSESWGYDTIDFVDEPVQPTGLSYVSIDFLTIYSTYTSGTATSTNPSNLVGGDSGGGDFIFNPTTQLWELAGINEVEGEGTIGTHNVTLSGYVQLSAYATQINALVSPQTPTDTPTMPPWTVVILGFGLLVAAWVGGKLDYAPESSEPSETTS